MHCLFEQEYLHLQLAKKECESYLKKVAKYIRSVNNLHKRVKYITYSIIPEIEIKSDRLMRFVLWMKTNISHNYENISKKGLSSHLQLRLNPDVLSIIRQYYQPTSTDIHACIRSDSYSYVLADIPNYYFDFTHLYALIRGHNY